MNLGLKDLACLIFAVLGGFIGLPEESRKVMLVIEQYLTFQLT